MGRRWPLVAGCIAALACGGGETAPPSEPRGDAARLIPVQVASAELGTAARSIAATGRVEPIRTVGINSQLAGALLEVRAEEGDAVAAGAVLARIDSRELAAQLASAEAALTVAQSVAGRAERLRDQGIVTVAEYERDRAAFVAARATRDQLRTRLGYATVRAPIGGTVLEQRVEAGDVVAPQARLFTLGDLSTLVVRVPVSELDVTALDEGDTVDVVIDALPGRTVRGRIRRVFPAADSVTRLVPVEVALTGSSAREVRPGFLARVTFRLDPRAGVLMVPAGAVLENAGRPAVFVVREGRASLRPIRPGGTYEGNVEVVDGLAAGDTVALAGNTMLRDGAAVRIVDAPPIDDAPATVPAAATSAMSAPAVGSR